MIRYAKNKEIDKKRWDDVVKQSPPHLPYLHSWYLDIVCKNWDALIQNDYEAVMPLPYKSKLGIKYIYQPFFTQQLGITGKNNTSPFLKAIPPVFKHIHYNFNFSNGFNTSDPQLKEQVNLILSLDKPYDVLKKQYSENCSRNIRKSLKHKISIEQCKPDELLRIFRATKGRLIRHLKDEHYAVLKKLFRNFETRKMCDCIGAYDEKKELIGGMLLLTYAKRKIFFFSAVTENGKKNSAQFFLLDSFFRENCGQDLIFDFEGSNSKDLARFYKGFGATEQNYQRLELNRLPRPLRFLKK